MKKKTTKKAPPKTEKPEYGIAELAKLLGVEETTCRVRLRNAGIKKKGRTYDFGSKAGLEKIAKQLEPEKKAA